MKWPLAVAVALCALAPGCLGSAANGSDTYTPSHYAAQANGAAAWQPRLAIALGDPKTSGLDGWTPLFDDAPTPFDFDGDGRAELIAQGSDSKVYVFDTKTGAALAVL